MSGSGMDPNVVGRNMARTFVDETGIRHIMVRGVTEESHHSGSRYRTCGHNNKKMS